MKTLVFPGSFDPLTNGHIDIIKRASKICDSLIVAIFINVNKNPMFSVEERIGFIRQAVSEYSNISVDSFSGMLSDYVELKHADAVIKGLRSNSDYEYENRMALMNKNLNPNFETLLMVSDIKHSFISSAAVKEIIANKGNIDNLVPEYVSKALKNKLK